MNDEEDFKLPLDPCLPWRSMVRWFIVGCIGLVLFTSWLVYEDAVLKECLRVHPLWYCL